MVATLYDIAPLLPLLDRGDWVLTPNQRLRNRIREAHAEARGPVSPTPRVYALQEWLDHCWQALQDRGLAAARRALVNDLQSRLIWKQIIEAPDGANLFASSRLVQQAGEALRNLILWEMPCAEVARQHSAEEYPLLHWAQQYRARLEALDLISREQTYEIILEAFQSGILDKLSAVHLESLGDLPPLLEKLLRAAAAEVKTAPTAAAAPCQRYRVETASVEEELRAAALWAHQRLQENATDRVIGIIVPDLGTSRDLVERIFTETFEAHYCAPGEDRYTLPFNISTGTPLGKSPLINSSLQLLKLAGQPVERRQLMALLNSPFWGDYQRESLVRGASLEHLERFPQFHYSPTAIRKAVQQVAERFADGLHAEASLQMSQRLQQAGSEWRRYARSAPAGEWVERILRLLETLGWPGSRPLDSVEYQQVRQWYQLLEKFASLELLQSSLTFNEAWSILQQLATATAFQAEVKYSPIQILGTLEGEGLRFDYCWVVGMTNRAWPPSPEPNPLLPLSLQRQAEMPRSSVEKEIAFAESLTRHYRHCAPTVVFSNAGQMDDARLSPSPLIADIPAVDLSSLLQGAEPGAAGLQALYRSERPPLEMVDCHYGPELATPDGEAVPGGTAILQQQSLCPFDAFARWRLGAAETADPEAGLSAADKGSIIHNAMAALWRGWRNQENFLRCTDPRALIEKTVDGLLADYQQRNDLGSRYLELEKARFVELIESFLDFERRRPAFEVIATESEQLGELAGLTFRLRMDRVDRLEDGRHVIIDYKTGAAANIRQWLGERPDEPQMPLYALCYPGEVAGIHFACLRAQEPGYCGVTDNSVPAWDPRIKTAQTLPKDYRREDWTTLLEEFRNHLGAIAGEYRQGYAAVEPKNVSTALRYNRYLLPLNRLSEADFLAFYLNTSESP